MEMMEKLSFALCFCSLVFFFLKRQCVREKIRCIFHYFWNCLNPLLSSLQSTKKTNKKAFFFVLSSPFFDWFFLSTFFPFLHFHHCCLCSLFPFIFLFICTCFSLLFLFSLYSFFFSLSQCFSSSFFLQSHVSLFFHRRFCVSSLGLTHFSSLFCFWSHSLFLHFFFVSVSFLSCQTKYKIFSFFFAEVFLNPPFSCV